MVLILLIPRSFPKSHLSKYYLFSFSIPREAKVLVLSFPFTNGLIMPAGGKVACTTLQNLFSVPLTNVPIMLAGGKVSLHYIANAYWLIVTNSCAVLQHIGGVCSIQ